VFAAGPGLWIREQQSVVGYRFLRPVDRFVLLGPLDSSPDVHLAPDALIFLHAGFVRTQVGFRCQRVSSRVDFLSHARVLPAGNWPRLRLAVELFVSPLRCSSADFDWHRFLPRLGFLFRALCSRQAGARRLSWFHLASVFSRWNSRSGRRSDL
jgi:hypothetical protein